jgi:hypothetical protein
MYSVLKTIKTIYEQIERKQRGTDEVAKVVEISNRISGLPEDLVSVDSNKRSDEKKEINVQLMNLVIGDCLST